MLFNTLEFAAFLIVVLALYAALPPRAQNRMLLVASYIFYGAWDWRFLGLILLSTAIDYAVALALAREHSPRRRKGLLATSVLANLGILGTFKYAGFFAENFARLFALFGIELSPFVLDIALPVGISFYTFQTLSYTIDVYRGQLAPTRRFLDFALFVAFFPQLVAGPIERATSLLPQILVRRRPSREQVHSGCWLILWGTFKKVVVADNLAFVVDAVYAPGADPTNAEVLLAAYAFFFQIYCDFSGYTDVARGTARIMGFELMLNFDLPAFATSISDLWNRWHISLGSWVRDYVYVPLGGNRRGKWITYRNLMVMFVLIGFWHGAAWTFVLFGAYNGVLMILHRMARPGLARIDPERPATRAAWWAFRVFAIFQLNIVSLVLFRASSLAQATSMIGSLLEPFEPGVAAAWLLPMSVLITPLVLMECWQEWTRDHEIVLRSPLWLRTAVYLAVAAFIVLLGEDREFPYVYFQF